MKDFDPTILKTLFLPHPSSHKGQNGKLMIIGGSHLFHAASLWALTIASRLVDMVFYASVPENNQIVHEAKKEFRNGIVVPQEEIEHYINEAECVLIGPGMLRSEKDISNSQLASKTIKDIMAIRDEGLQSYYLTKYLLEKYSYKKWVIDAGALQMAEPEWFLQLEGNVVITPHPIEFERIKGKIRDKQLKMTMENEKIQKKIELFAKEFGCIVLLKGQEDIICSSEQCMRIVGGNAGMTKGGTGDVLAGLVAALACKNDLFLSAVAGSSINKAAGDALFKRVGYYFNASDLANEIPSIMKQLLH